MYSIPARGNHVHSIPLTKHKFKVVQHMALTEAPIHSLTYVVKTLSKMNYLKLIDQIDPSLQLPCILFYHVIIELLVTYEYTNQQMITRVRRLLVFPFTNTCNLLLITCWSCWTCWSHLENDSLVATRWRQGCSVSVQLVLWRG